MNQAVDKNDKICWCPSPNCTFVFEFDRQDDFECPICKKHYCIKCRDDFHKNMTCAEWENSKDDIKNGSAALAEYAKANNLKRCPSCKSYCEKKSGCDYIPCKCGQKWCFKCEAIYENFKCTKCGMKHGYNELNAPIAK